MEDLSIRYLFNSHGDWIATQVGDNVFSASDRWLGKVREQDKAVISPDDRYLGSILRFDRLYYLEDHLPAAPGSTPPEPPSRPLFTGFPGKEEAQELPPGSRDVEL
jgi:hypothetical protein